MWLANCILVDVEDGGASREGSLRIEDGAIVEVADALPRSADNVVDLQGRFLSPGLISCHTHFTEVYPFSSADEDESPAVSTLRALHSAKQALWAGVTTVRCTHEQNRADIWLRLADANGWTRAPRILAAGRAISTTGGHGDYGIGCAIADGPEEFFKVARTELAAGADHIKVFVSGGIANLENLDAVQMTSDEMRAVVSVTDMQGSYVVAHAANSASIKLGLEAGIRSFEHAYQLDEETATRMATQGVFLTPTLNVTHCIDRMRAVGFEESQIDRAARAAPMHRRSIETAIHAGVKLVNGVDGGPGEPIDGTSLAVIETELLADAGLSSQGALRTATVNAAELLGIGGHVGTIREGADADVIAMKRDPLSDVRALRTIDFVMRRGEVVRDEREGRTAPPID